MVSIDRGIVRKVECEEKRETKKMAEWQGVYKNSSGKGGSAAARKEARQIERL
jgi:hypothetical protein